MFADKLTTSTSAGMVVCWVLLGSAAVADHGTLTEPQVRTLYAEVARALNRRDVEFVLDRIADDASLETRTSDNERISVEQFSKTNYRAAMRQLYGEASTYHCSLRVAHVHLDDDHDRADVLYTMTERWRDRDGWQVTVTRGQTELKMRDGKLVATEFILWVSGPHEVI